MAHSSYINENPTEFPESNERLEFLGDAIIGAAVASELYRRFPNWPEGELTQARSLLVRGETLTDVAKRLCLGRNLYMGKGEEAAGGRERPTNLASALEALVGAVLIDLGYDAASSMVLRLLSQELETVGENRVLKSPKSILQEIIQGKSISLPVYTVAKLKHSGQIHQFTANVTVDGKTMGIGTGSRKSQAEEEAAAAALKALEAMS